MPASTILPTVRLGCVPEHFSSPIYRAIAQGAFESAGVRCELVNCPSGTGEMVKALTEDRIDVAIALTEGLVAALANGANAFKLVGTYTASPLTWSIATNPSRYNPAEREKGSWESLRGARIGISRFGSGSHIIPFCLAQNMGWLGQTGTDKPPFEFIVLNDLKGLREGIRDATIDAFLWERIMTKPYYDSGELHHLSNITPKWPAFMFAASQKILAQVPAAVSTLLRVISAATAEFMGDALQSGESISYVGDRFREISEEDVRVWFKSVEYAKDASEVSSQVIDRCVDVLRSAGVIKGGHIISAQMLCDEAVAKIVV
ncbi:hypothetical protein HK104_008481 [Borealophlyctis nickersoniae]|nr:hypothetical protein HK104_008481 [Borealophlyctis nickersoniae]